MSLIAHRASARRACLGFLFLWGIVVWASLSAAAAPIPKPEGPVNDFAHVISAPYEQKMTATIMELYRKTGIPVVVVTMPDIGGEDYNEYANRLYEAWGIGKKGEDKGVLVFLTLKERKMRIEVGYGLEGVIPDGLAGEIRDRYMTPYLKKNNFDEGLLNGVLEIAQIIAKASGVQITGQAPAAPPQRKGQSALTFFPIILIFLFFLIFRRRRGGSWLLFLPLLMGGGRGPGYGGGGIGGGFGGFGGGFGGFGGGMSGGGGAGGGF